MSNTKRQSSNSVVAAPVNGAVADLRSQRAYVDKMKLGQFDFSLTIADVFLQGMRRAGYKNTARALDELVDNALQAGADRIEVVFGYDGSEKTKQPSAIAVVDNGHGMDADMIRLAMVWGGTHRADDRTGFGRFGFGLPSASLSQARRYSVISRVAGGSAAQVTFDSDDLVVDGKMQIPAPKPAALPAWLTKQLKPNVSAFKHGTIVVLEHLDNLSWKMGGKLQTELVRHFGACYRNYLGQSSIRVNDELVKPVDPLFLTEGALYFDYDDQRAEAVQNLEIPVKDLKTGSIKGNLRVRLSYMPWGFVGETDGQSSDQRGTKNPRFAVLKAYNDGVVITRHGRQIDVVPIPGGAAGWFDMIHRDRHWGCEIDFPPELDEEFDVATSKQGVRPSPRIWDLLSEHGVKESIRQMKVRRERERADKSQGSQPERTSADVMERIAAHRRTKFAGDDPERIRQAKERLEREVDRRAKVTGVPREDVARALVAQVFSRPYAVVRESAHDGPFYRVSLMGQQKQLVLNTDHRFFTDLYAAPDSTDRIKSALLLLLFVLADSEIDAINERYEFYRHQRVEWSNMLSSALVTLNDVNLAHLEELREDTDQVETLSLDATDAAR